MIKLDIGKTVNSKIQYDPVKYKNQIEWENEVWNIYTNDESNKLIYMDVG